MSSTHHIIRKLTFEVNIPSEEQGFNIQNIISDLFNSILERELEKLLDAMDNRNEVISIDKLEIDLGFIEENIFEQDLPEKLKEHLEEKLREVITSARMSAGNAGADKEQVTIKPVNKSKLDLLLHFLQTGTMPWWAKSEERSVSVLIMKLLEDSPSQLKDALEKIFRNRSYSKRFVYQLTDPIIAEVLKLYDRSFANFAADSVSDLCTIHHRNSFTDLYSQGLRLTCWSYFIQQAIEKNTSSRVTEKAAHLRTLITQLQPQGDALLFVIKKARQMQDEQLLRTEDLADVLVIAKQQSQNKQDKKARKAKKREDEENNSSQGRAKKRDDENNSFQGKAKKREDEENNSPQGKAKKREDEENNSSPRKAKKREDEENDPSQEKAKKREDEENDPSQGKAKKREDEENNSPDKNRNARKAKFVKDKDHAEDTAEIDEDITEGKRSSKQLSKEKLQEQLKKAFSIEDNEEIADVLADGIYINNAGLVIVWPYILPFFRQLELVAGNEFVSEEASHRAVHILQYLATGETAAEEHELVLNKLLCGIDPEEPVSALTSLSEAEKKECEDLLNNIIANWAALKNISAGALRSTFLVKEGILRRDNGWMLKIERTTVDMLIDKLPWGISMIKLPWNVEMIYVEW